MNVLLKYSYINISKTIMRIFFEKKYLNGRWFDNNIKGWKWCWRSLIFQKLLGINRHIPFPVSHNSVYGKAEDIYFDVDDMNNFQHFGCYFQNWNGGIITIGKGTYIAPNVGLITENHNMYDLDTHEEPKDITIGKHCWIGMNSVVLPGVILGDYTIVGAGAVVTHSFLEGHCVIGGVPALKIKDLDKDLIKKTH